MARVLIGTSGWHYASWRGPFFPKPLLLKHQLQYYASQFATAELNGVFYRTPSLEAVKAWRAQTGRDFVFAWKASKFITHWKRLSGNSVNSLELIEERLSLLGEKAGPVSAAAEFRGRRRASRILPQAAVGQAPLQFRISASELVPAVDLQAAVRAQHRPLPLRPS
jgi:hypothetical protein